MSDNTTPEPQLSEQEKLRRERDLLLTTFEPSEFDFPSDSGSFAALAEHVRTEHGDLTWGPGQPPVEEKPAQRQPERPTNGEEPSA
jgi:hypothetical protein